MSVEGSEDVRGEQSLYINSNWRLDFLSPPISFFFFISNRNVIRLPFQVHHHW